MIPGSSSELHAESLYRTFLPRMFHLMRPKRNRNQTSQFEAESDQLLYL